MLRVSLDFETYSEVDLRKVGAWRYAEDPSTEVLCAAISDADDPVAPVRLWLPHEPPPLELELADEVHAWNAEFEFVIALFVCQRHYGWPELPLDRFRCSMSLAMSFGLPGRLDLAARALGVSEQKDARGAHLIAKLCKPRSRVSKANPEPRWTPATAPDDFAEFYRYCQQDVRTERAVAHALPRRALPPEEQRTYFESIRSNQTGVPIDLQAVEGVIAAVETYSLKLEREHVELTQCPCYPDGLKSGQVEKIRDWLGCCGSYKLADLRSETVERARKAAGLRPKVRRVLDLRASLGQTSVKKLDAMRRSCCRDGRIHGMLQYHGAATGRWAGRLVQLQNLKKPDKELGQLRMEDWIEHAAETGFDPDSLELFGDPMSFFTAFVRPCLAAKPGHVFLVADFNAIECRVLAWLAGETWLLDTFARNGDVYVVQASDLYGYKVEKATHPKEREIGKRIVLGCGYQMGAPKFRDTSVKYGADCDLPFAENAVASYRRLNRRIVQFWYDMQDAAREAIKKPGLEVRVRHIGFRSTRRILQMKLPSSRLLTYWNPRLEEGQFEPRIVYDGLNSVTKQWGPQDTYGGRLVENATQAVARDLCRDAILRVVDHGYRYLFSSHDEIVSEVPWINANVERYCELMARVPEWAKGCPIHAEGWSGTRYRK